MEIDGLNHLECTVLDGLAEPAPLYEIAEAFAASVVGPRLDPKQVAALLSPALASLVSNGLVEVHRFTTWPGVWQRGISMGGSHLASLGGRPDVWLRHPDSRAVLVAGATCEGIRWM